MIVILISVIFDLVHQHVVVRAVPEVEDYGVAVVYYAAKAQDLAHLVGLLEGGD